MKMQAVNLIQEGQISFLIKEVKLLGVLVSVGLDEMRYYLLLVSHCYYYYYYYWSKFT